MLSKFAPRLAVVGLSLALFGAKDTDDGLTRFEQPPTPIDASGSYVFGLRWSRQVVRDGFYRTVDASFGQPAVSVRNDMVVVATGEGYILGFDLGTGKQRWKQRYVVPFESHISLVEHRAPDGNSYDRAVLTTRDGSLIALDVRSGQTEWEAELGAESQAPITVVGERIIVATAVNKLHVLDRKSGKSLWVAGRSPPAGLSVRGHSAATVHGDRVYASFSDGYVEAYRIQDGSRLWSRPLSFSADGFVDADADPKVADGKVFVASYTDGIYALDADDGRTLWTRPAPSVTSLEVVEDVVIAASADGYLWGLTQEEGEQRYRLRMRAGPTSRLKVHQGYAILTSGDMGLIVVSAENGRPVQATAFGSRVSGDIGWGSNDRDIALLTSGGSLHTLSFGGPGRVN